MENKEIFNKLFIFDMANNHMGSLEHGLRIIREVHEVCKDFDFKFGIKFQYRDLDTFIHPDFKDRFDFKYIKRFSQTRLSKEQFKELKEEIERLGFISVCTPFDEVSVDLIEEHNFQIIKIGSCSATDWPLLERIARRDRPIILSCAGLPLEEIDKVVSFLKHRKKVFCLMHCVAEYPTSRENLQLNQIDLLKSRYPDIKIGYSTHESPDNFDAIKIAISKGACVFEKHIGIKTEEFDLNAYSATPEQIKLWLNSAQEAFKMCGVIGERTDFSEKELSTLRSLRRGVFAKCKISREERIDLSKVFFAIPTLEGQITANDFSKYTEFYAKKEILPKEPIFLNNTRKIETREKIYSIVQKVKSILKESGVVISGEVELEISHHYGVDRFQEYGCTIITCVNREYCKKLIVLLSGQSHPEQYHKLKEETFQVLYGDIMLTLNGIEHSYKPGDIVTIERGAKHSFSSQGGAVIEEISSTHHPEDSYYSDEEISKNPYRKTVVSYWLD